ncbi:MAG: LptA/OstA family protein, partial [Xanthobacteraceae bacterium]
MSRRTWLSLLAVLVFSTPAVAQGPQSGQRGLLPGARGQDQNQPVQIDARSLDVHDKSKTATFSGNVKVVQGDTTMTCKTLVVFYGHEIGITGNKPVAATNSTSGTVPDAQNIRRIEARGGVTVVSRDQTASGDLGVYDLATKTITLSGNVVVTQGKNVIHGARVIVDTVTGNAHVESAPGSARGGVRALIIPQKGQNGEQSNFMT